jgi:hypothetical protein
MGLIAFIILACLVGSTIWCAIRYPEERKKLANEFAEEPVEFIFVSLWVLAIFVFVIGIFVPVIGEIKIGRNGLTLWQIGGLLSLLGLILQFTFFASVRRRRRS